MVSCSLWHRGRFFSWFFFFVVPDDFIDEREDLFFLVAEDVELGVTVSMSMLVVELGCL